MIDDPNPCKKKEVERRGISRAIAGATAKEAGGITKEAGPMRHKGQPWSQKALRKEARPRPEAVCRMQARLKSQDRLQTQPGPVDPVRREGTKTPGKK